MNKSNFIAVLSCGNWHMLFGACRVKVFGFCMSLDECLCCEIDNMGKTPSKH